MTDRTQPIPGFWARLWDALWTPSSPIPRDHWDISWTHPSYLARTTRSEVHWSPLTGKNCQGLLVKSESRCLASGTVEVMWQCERYDCRWLMFETTEEGNKCTEA